MYATLPFTVPGLRVVALASRLGDAEVHQLHAAAAADQDVVRADVPVHEVQGSSVTWSRKSCA
jgi:hypothetical protein